MTIEQTIKNKAHELGFELAGITTAEPADENIVQFFKDWLSMGCAAEMNYLHRNLEKRFDPAKLLENAKSVICLGYCYKPDRSTAKHSPASSQCRIADYALYPDYHAFLKKKLFELANHIKNNTDREFDIKACVDSVPIAERLFAQRAGLGFIGKNTMLINPKLGSQFFLAELITTLDLTPDKPTPHDCGSCSICIDSCPASAISSKGYIDTRKCLSYLTIEHKGNISSNLAKNIGSCLFGCDQCVKLCPYEKKTKPVSKKDFKPNTITPTLDLKQILTSTDQELKTLIKGTSLERLSIANLRRNARICLQNSEE